jgi:pimeloyl-ACP methyl ester carboxylesterase
MLGCSTMDRQGQAPAMFAGGGESVLLLHGSARTSAIWRGTADNLRSLDRVIAPDLIGYGGAAFPSAREAFDSEAEVHAIEPMLCC